MTLIPSESITSKLSSSSLSNICQGSFTFCYVTKFRMGTYLFKYVLNLHLWIWIKLKEN
ncbi:hypothetical protein N665_0571s0001 [Sinapis alba]|nr:hypothetical protein N665_0571s0001 [Sinapis alba]